MAYPATFTGTQWLLPAQSRAELAVQVSCPFAPRSQGVSLWGRGVAGIPLARTARVWGRAPESGSLAGASGQRGHCWGGGRAASARPLVTKLPAVVEPCCQALGPLASLPPPRAV